MLHKGGGAREKLEGAIASRRQLEASFFEFFSAAIAPC